MSKHRDDEPTTLVVGDCVRLTGDDTVHLIGSRTASSPRYSTVCGLTCQGKHRVNEGAFTYTGPVCRWTTLKATCLVCIARWSG